ncbi:MAG TPA: BON domain-containing protein [Ktedonobacterales bacterium]|nr:BON domain-containing protein [Ktedonobacterales bacterium]
MQPSTSATEFAAVSKYRFGTPVFTDDGDEGSLDSLIVDPQTRAITGMRVRYGLFGRELYTLPIAVIRHATPENVKLHKTREELKRDYSTVSSVMLLTSGTQVVVANKSVGKLTQVTVNRETQALRHLVVEHGLRSESVVSAQNISAIEGKRIIIGTTADTTAPMLTPYRPDEELHEEIRSAIYDYPRLRVDLPGIGIHVIDGVLWLQGHVSSDLNKRLVVDQLTNIRGLGETHNELIADTDLAAAVSMALAKDPRTARERIGVYPALGHIHLRGRARSGDARTAAYAVAWGVPGVKDVENALIVDPSAEVIPVMAGITNEEDRVPGGN